ncbi:choice-of-anchor I family protein [Microbacterium halophytorum]|uniref:choice-of-anchor I family protein n=1 Tax=Microbacterium halophytorum TaxID=2067568 RepID=UPI000CFD062D|nr:choice-of-anchor I family protein [Microbacterium halophytorum]
MPELRPRRRRAIATLATAAAIGSLAVVPMTAANAAVVAEPLSVSADGAAVSLNPVGSFETGVFDESAAEIVQAYGDRLFVVNAQAGAVAVLDAADPAAMTELFRIGSAGVANSVAVRDDGLGVIAFEAETKTDAGHLLFFDANADSADAAVLGTVEVGALPDMVTISPDGAYALVANEGEPAEDFSLDPEGSIGVVALPEGIAAPAQADVRTADFHAFEGDALPEGVRVFGPAPHGDDLPVSRNLEPEYIATAGGTAYATLQEANSIAVVDIASAEVTDILALPNKDHGQIPLDPSDRDPEGTPEFEQRTYDGLYGIPMPDAISAYEAGGETYLVTANEGDAREWGDYVESVRVKDLEEEGYGPVCETSSLADDLGDEDLGRLNVSIEEGFDAEAGCYEELSAFGARSFSIWTTDGEVVYDSAAELERIAAEAAPGFANSNHSESNAEGRSDDKGPEPESVEIGTVDGRTYAFVANERVGGIAVYDVTDPAASAFVTYVNNRDFSVSVEDADDPSAVLAQAGDLGPESIEFIPAESSPSGEAMIAVGNEVSGTTTMFEVAPTAEESATTDIQVLTINDFHGRIEPNLRNGEAGAAVLAGAIDQYRAENPNTLFASAGDNIGASTFTSFIQQDNPTIDALVEAGLDVSVVGNHEFDGGFDDLTDRVIPRFGSEDLALGANVYRKGTTEPALAEYAVRTVDGVDVAFIGTVTEDTSTLVSPAGIADIEFGDQVEAANRVAEEIAENDLADVTVLLTHSGSGGDQCDAIAEEGTSYGELVRGASAEIDAIVSGHTHQLYDCDIAGPDGAPRPVISSHQYGTTLGALDIRVDSETQELVSIEGTSVPLVVEEEPQFSENEAVRDIVDEAILVADEEGSVEVGKISADILRGGEPAGDDRGVESSMGNLVADMYLWSASEYSKYGGAEPAQIGIMNPGGLRDDLRYGEDGTVTYRDVANVQPFANTLVTTTLTGEQLEGVLEEQWQPDGSERSKLHLGVSEGFSYEYVEEAEQGERIVSMTYQGEEVQPEDEILVVTNSFVASGGDNFTTFAEGVGTADSGLVDLTASVDYFAEHDVVDPAPLGRAIPVDGSDDDTSSDDSSTDDAGTDDPGTDGTGTDDSGTDDSGTDDAGTDDAGTDAGTDGGSSDASGSDDGELAVTGANVAWGVGIVALLMLGAGGVFLAIRRRSAAE